MKSVKLTYAQVSFLWNNLSTDCTKHGWYAVFNDRCSEFYEFDCNTVFELQLDELDGMYFVQDMKDEAEEILRQLKMDVFYGSFNEISNITSLWCLGMLSDILKSINNALNNR